MIDLMIVLAVLIILTTPGLLALVLFMVAYVAGAVLLVLILNSIAITYAGGKVTLADFLFRPVAEGIQGIAKQLGLIE